jgi:hypothetical protein
MDPLLFLRVCNAFVFRMVQLAVVCLNVIRFDVVIS